MNCKRRFGSRRNQWWVGLLHFLRFCSAYALSNDVTSPSLSPSTLPFEDGLSLATGSLRGGPAHDLEPSSPTNTKGTGDFPNGTQSDFGGGILSDFGDWYASESGGSHWSVSDILVFTFFVIAAIWLLVAIFYSLIILFLLRLQARGELDIYDENFGIYQFCGGRFTLRLSCILRRCAIQLEQEQQARHLQLYQGQGQGLDGSDTNLPPVRIMTRGERRMALEKLLLSRNKVVNSPDLQVPAGDSSTAEESEDRLVCAICLDDFDNNGSVFASSACVHCFHKNCIMDWLERKQNTECPCCRKSMVSDDDIWEIVKKKRKEIRRQLRKEKGWRHFISRWVVKCLHRSEPYNTSSNGEGQDEDTSASEIPDSIPLGTDSVGTRESVTEGNSSSDGEDDSLTSSQHPTPAQPLPCPSDSTEESSSQASDTV